MRLVGAMILTVGYALNSVLRTSLISDSRDCTYGTVVDSGADFARQRLGRDRPRRRRLGRGSSLAREVNAAPPPRTQLRLSVLRLQRSPSGKASPRAECPMTAGYAPHVLGIAKSCVEPVEGRDTPPIIISDLKSYVADSGTVRDNDHVAPFAGTAVALSNNELFVRNSSFNSSTYIYQKQAGSRKLPRFYFNVGNTYRGSGAVHSGRKFRNPSRRLRRVTEVPKAMPAAYIDHGCFSNGLRISTHSICIRYRTLGRPRFLFKRTAFCTADLEIRRRSVPEASVGSFGAVVRFFPRPFVRAARLSCACPAIGDFGGGFKDNRAEYEHNAPGCSGGVSHLVLTGLALYPRIVIAIVVRSRADATATPIAYVTAGYAGRRHAPVASG
ncbi:unnamed protein product, partial [Iphiclides podalirius]